jgi:Ca-activated chloride channel homolog
MIDFLGIHFANAEKLIFLPVVIFIIFLLIKNYLKAKNACKLLVHSENQKIVFPSFSIKKQLIKTVCLCGAVILIFLAWLQPQWGKKETKIVQEGRDLLILLDISRSMLAKDLKPNRLEFTKLKIRNLLKKLDFERVGLILYSGTAFLQCPLTIDHSAFLMFLDQVDVETIASGTTAVDSALNKAIEVFGQTQERKNKLVVLATDGEDFSLNLENIKRKALEQNIKLFTLGIGTLQGAPVPILDMQGNVSGHEVDEKGKIILTCLNERLLQEVSEDLGGTYLRTNYDDSDLNQLANIIKSYEKEKFDDKKMSYYQDQYPWLLSGAFLLLLLEWIL